MNAAISDEGPKGNQLTTLWAAPCTYLKANLAPSLVRFSFCCELSSAVAARRTATSLELLPMMASCEIRFGPDEDKTFQALARRTVQKAMKQEDKQFPIERLPSTLRARVLYFTELVARPRKIQIHNGRQSPQFLGCCGNCSDAYHYCLCMSRPSTISDTCQCVIVPSCLFWLSRSLSDEAISVYYLETQFRLSGDPLRNLAMLKRLPSSSVKLIRYLEYQMHEHLLEKLTDPYHIVHENWSSFITFVRDNFNLSRLYFHLSTEDFVFLGPLQDPRYKRAGIMAPLRVLQGLKGASLDIPSFSPEEKEDVERAMVGPRYVKLTEEERERITRGEDVGLL